MAWRRRHWILVISLSHLGGQDERCWMGSTDGIYGAKDSYTMTMSLKDNFTCSSGPDPIWAHP